MVHTHPERMIGLGLSACYKKQLCIFHDKAITLNIKAILTLQTD